MSTTISENYLSRSFTLGGQTGRELVFDIRGAADENDAAAVLAATAPTTYQGLRLDTLSADPVGGTVWRGYARYSKLQADYEYTFDTGGGTAHVTQSLGTVGSYAPAGETAPNFNGAIGVSEDKVEGVDVVTPQYQFSETHYFTDAQVTTAFKFNLARMTGRFNDAAFRDFAAGEVLFLGASGGKRSDDNWSITYRFAASPNVTGLSVGGTVVGFDSDPYTDYIDLTDNLIEGIDKLGWDYIWFRYGEYEDAAALALVKRPLSAHVERVYYPGDFSTLGIGT